MRIFYNQTVDAFARRLIPGIAVLALSSWGIATGGSILEELPALTTTAQAAELPTETSTDDAAATAAGIYTDGTYTGTSAGFGGSITVSVTIQDSKITAIEIVSASGETASYLSRAKRVIDTILETQSTDVDAVSGATYSSNGIINAVKNALIKASGGTVNESASSGGAAQSSSAGRSTSSDSFTDAAAYADGTYTGSATGFGGTITVRVKITDGKITAVSLVSASGETASYLSKAKAVINKVISAQSPNVDAVSGATYSSNGILNAIKQALNKAAAAASNGTSNTTDEEDTPTEAKPDRTYIDGIYTGVGEGYGGDIAVSVTILDGRVNAIDVVSAEDETPSFFSRARALLQTILSKQTTADVDVISGATYSSQGLLDAVNAALDKAAEENNANPDVEKTPDTDDDSNSGDSGEDDQDTDPQPTETTTEEFTYTGTASCTADADGDFEDYSITVAFTVTQTTTVETDADGNTTTTTERKLTNVEVTSPTQQTAGDNWIYIKKAINGSSKATGIAAQAIAKQGLDGIDAVSGATCSSNAIIRAASQCELNLGKSVT